MTAVAQATPSPADMGLDPRSSDRADTHARWHRDTGYDRLLEGLHSGLFGGLPNRGSAAAAIVEVLRRRDWPVDFRAFAGAVPHFAPLIGIAETRSTLQHLGFATDRVTLRGRDLADLPEGSFIARPGDRIAFCTPGADGRAMLVDAAGGQAVPIRPDALYRCFRVEDAREATRTPTRRESWIGSLVARFAPENRLLLFVVCLSNALVVVGSLSIGFIFDKVLPARAVDTLLFITAGIGVMFLFDLRLRRLKAQILGRVSGRIEYIVSSALFERLMSFPLSMVQSAAVSEQLNRLRQFEKIRDFYAGPAVAVLFEMPFVLLLLGVLFLIDPGIAGIILGVVAVYAPCGVVMYPRIARNARTLGALSAECQRLQEETIGQRQQLLDRGLAGVWLARSAPRFGALARARSKVDAVWRSLSCLIAVLSPLALGAVILAGATRVMAGELTGGLLIASTIIATRLLGPVQQALLLAVRAPDIRALLRQIDAMQRIGRDDAPPASHGKSALGVRAEAPAIRLDSLVVRYPRTAAASLRGISLTFEAGTLTCVTGSAGAGKSTLLRAIAGHIPAQNGMVLIGADNIRQIPTADRAAVIGCVGHRTLQLHGSLAQNLRLTRPEASDAELREIATELRLIETIEALPDGFDTRYSEADRHHFSPAFRSKFALAQALLKGPTVLLLDEPESALSDADEAAILDALHRRAGRLTGLIVSHRPSLARQADRILQLQDGQVKSFGPPAKQSRKDR